MRFPHDLAEKLKRKIAVVKDGAIRHALLSQELASLDAEFMAEALGAIIERAAGSATYKDMLQSLGDLSELHRRSGRQKMKQVLEFCAANNLTEPLKMLSRIPPHKRAEDHPEDVYIDRDLKEETLGMRKTMGRLGNRDLINRLLHDQDPDVVEQILANPGLTEEQVVRIAAKRPTSSEVLRRISRSMRWSRSYRVRKSLVFNPYTPTEISISLLRLLFKQDVVAISQDQNLHAELRSMARRLLRQWKSQPVFQDDEM